jgi:hypothetical protein
MKTFILAALVAVSTIATGVVTANADTFAVHGYQGTHYGR